MLYILAQFYVFDYSYPAYFFSKSGGSDSPKERLFSASPFISFNFLILFFLVVNILFTLTISSSNFNGKPFTVPPVFVFFGMDAEALDIRGSLVNRGDNFIMYGGEGTYCNGRGLNFCENDAKLIVSGDSFD